MPRNISDIVNFMQYVVRKQRGVYLTPEDATTNLDIAQLDAFEEWFSLYGKTQTIHDALRPFRVYYNFTSDASGFVALPPNYMHIVGTPFTVYGSSIHEINFYNEDEWINAVRSQLRPVSMSNPIARDTGTGFSIYPQQAQAGFFTYLKRPTTPRYSKIVLPNRQILYDAVNSIQMDWDDQYLNHIIAKALKYVAVNMDDKDVYAFSEQYNKEG